ncbi:MAG: hypothetical protein VW420_03660 [Schleiferiaceae bacterium]|jgi:hypothetical protein
MSILGIIGFILAGYSVVANDSVQTLGTWISSNKDRFKWWVLWLSASGLMVLTLLYGWYTYDGDISFGRLDKIPFMEVQWYHAVAPLVLLVLTRQGIPVSTSFLVLSAFASSFVLEKMLMKSIVGYVVAAISAYVLWVIMSKLMDESEDVKKSQKSTWRVLQWLSTGFLWYSWLSQDMANIAVFLPRQLSLPELSMILVFFTATMGWIFYTNGGKIQNIIIEKKNTKYIRSATMIDFVYAFLLLYFKELNNIPMSTTWVFVGLLSGREIALQQGSFKKKGLKTVFPMLIKDFIKLLIGLTVSVGIVLAIQYFFNK